MKRAAALVIVFTLLGVVTTGCEDDSPVGVDNTGVEVRFSDCLVFGVNVFIDDRYQGTASTEREMFFPLDPGSYTLFARSNASLENQFFCWERTITVSNGSTTVVSMSCKDADCED